MRKEDIKRPIIVLGASRSGTSLTAGIFAKHGVWVGNQQSPAPMNPKGFFENTDFKQILKKEYLPIKNLQYPEPKNDFIEKVINVLKAGNYQGGDWMLKHGGIHWRLWLSWKPQYVCVRRPLAPSNASRAKAGIPEMPEAMWNRIQDGMDMCVEKHGGVNVYTDKFLDGDFSDIVNALKAAKIKPDMSIIKDFYDPSLWHHRA